jgi:hypothetical protein
MITTLPVEIQQTIYDKLNVKDRTILEIALGKNKAIQTKPKYKEKKLCIIAKAIEKKKITKISRPIKDFLKTCDPSDPTIIEITNVFPEVPMSPSFETLNHKIIHGQVKLEDLKDIPDINKNTYNYGDDVWVFKSSIFMAHIDSFMVLMQHPAILIWLSLNSTIVFSNLFNYVNERVLEYIFAEGSEILGWDLEYLSTCIKLNKPMFYTRSVRRLIMRFISLSHEDYQTLWVDLLERMDIEGIEDVEEKMKELGLVI